MKKRSLPKHRRLKSLTVYERKAESLGFKRVAGVDEAGRGPLAGPVVAAACILPNDLYLPGIDDSKKLSPQERERLYAQIMEDPSILSGVGVVEAVIIDQVNILQATFLAMAAAVLQLKEQPDYVLVDGNQLPPLNIPAEGIVEGDTLSQSIMAAAIIAKVTRDRIMLKLHERWPEYGFAEHKGYPTPQHLEKLKRLGACPEHRRSYAPVKEVISA
jgi:ribonuclease HII